MKVHYARRALTPKAQFPWKEISWVYASIPEETLRCKDDIRKALMDFCRKEDLQYPSTTAFENSLVWLIENHLVAQIEGRNLMVSKLNGRPVS